MGTQCKACDGRGYLENELGYVGAACLDCQATGEDWRSARLDRVVELLEERFQATLEAYERPDGTRLLRSTWISTTVDDRYIEATIGCKLSAETLRDALHQWRRRYR